jgi:hypothetical protein
MMTIDDNYDVKNIDDYDDIDDNGDNVGHSVVDDDGDDDDKATFNKAWYELRVHKETLKKTRLPPDVASICADWSSVEFSGSSASTPTKSAKKMWST